MQSDDLDTDGFETFANAVNLNGGSIVSAGSTAIDADLAHNALNHGFGVDGSLVSTPKVASTSLIWPPAMGGAYGLGDRITPGLCFDLPVEVKGRPQLRLNIGGQLRHASHTSTFGASGSRTCLFFWYTVQADDLDRDGISVPANALELNGGAITLEVDEGITAELGHEAIEDDGDHRVDGGVAVAPMVTSVSFSGVPSHGGPYGAGDVITARVAFDKALAVSGEPRLALAVGPLTRYAEYVGQTMVELIDVPYIYKRNFFSLSFEYTVQPGDMDMDGISIPANALDLNGGSLTLMGSPGTAADLSHSAVNPDETRLVDAPDTAPTFSTAIAGQVWLVNEAVSLELPEAVGGDGELTYSLSPELPAGLTFDAGTRLLSGMPTALADRMAFQYTVTDGDLEDPESATLTFSMSVIAQSASEVGAQSVGDDSVEVAWRGQWSDESRGRLVIEARSPTMDWTVVGTVDPSSGEFVVRGLEPETPHTFRLRFESPDRAAARTASAQTSAEYSEEFSVTTGSYTGACRSGGKYLCLRDGRFELRADWTNPDRVGDFGVGTAVPVDISDESGLFWFFSPANIELVTKVLDGSRLNGYYWMFFGALSDVEYWLTLRDTAVGGAQRTYHNPPKEVCGQSDTRAFPGDLAALLGLSSSDESSIPGGLDPVQVAAVPLELSGTADASDSGGSCESSDERLCLLGNRFSVEVSFIDPNISDPDVNPEGTATVAPSLGTANTGFFWFFNRENIELAVKVLDGRGINGRFWLLYGALSDVEYEIVVTDTVTGESKMYRNEVGSVCGEIDTGAF
ncbi:MAG: putative Ig domain-containing protein [Acidobacteria bacterium]|nr:putative Ig domain-containing protein [Acidobacteriota bacterium]